MTAASSLSANATCRGGPVVDNIGPRVSEGSGDTGTSSSTSRHETNHADNGSHHMPPEPEDGVYPWRDNFNLSPGHDAVVFTLNKQTGALEMDRKIWGLVTKGGTANNPVPKGPSKHFANLMFNARSDTLFSKPTFARLLNEGKTCVVAFDGFFEWKADALGGGKGKKQPYFVFRKDTDTPTEQRKPLLLAGLWTSVHTGWDHQPTLDTFTVLTTEVCDPLKWLHSRMPVTIWDEDLALQWLKDPSQRVHQQIDIGARRTQENCLDWHSVSTQMSSTKYRSADSVKALPTPKSVKSFFAPAKKEDAVPKTTGSIMASKHQSSSASDAKVSQASPLSAFAASKKHSIPSPQTKQSSISKPSSPKKAKKTTNTPDKKGTITSFFSPKTSKS